MLIDINSGFEIYELDHYVEIFYRTYPDAEKCYTLCGKLSWSHNRLIMRVASKYLPYLPTEDELKRELGRQ